MKSIFAVAGIAIKELYRRKDFYVLFILIALICLVMASVNIFNDDKIIRYLKELCLLLIWISSLVIAITTAARQIPAERENRTLLPLLNYFQAAAAGQTIDAAAIDSGKIFRLLVRLRSGPDLFLLILRRIGGQPGTSVAAAELFSGRGFALVHARRGGRADAARLAGVRGAVL
jgi:hypothetical protein